MAYMAIVGTCGCKGLGPADIEGRRMSYNDSVATTAREQTLINVIRAYKYEPIQVVDVSSVNSQSSFLAQITPALTASGTSQFLGKTATVGSELQYTETPTVTYTPLQGSALVTQLATPINVDSIVQLYDSNWRLVSIFALIVDHISVKQDDYWNVVDDIDRLDHQGALTLAAIKSPETAATTATASGTNDALLVMCDPDRARSEYYKNSPHDMNIASTQPATQPEIPRDLLDPHQLWPQLRDKYSTNAIPPFAQPKTQPSEYSIELRTGPATQPSMSNVELKPIPIAADTQQTTRTKLSEFLSLSGAQAMPVLRTRSALGMLMTATSPYWQTIVFLRPDDALYKKYWHVYENRRQYAYMDFDTNPSTSDRLHSTRSTEPYPLRSPTTNPVYPPATQPSTSLSGYRHYICVLHEPGLPFAPPFATWEVYVSTYYDGEWYWIAKDDVVSQQNFELVHLILAIQSVAPTSTGSPTPSLPLSGGGGGGGH